MKKEKAKMIEAINNAIINKSEIVLTFGAPSPSVNAFNIGIVPDDFDTGDEYITIFSGKDIFVIGTSTIACEDESFICGDGASMVIINIDITNL